MSKPPIELLTPEQAKEAAATVGLPEMMANLNVFAGLLHDPPVAKAMADLLATLLFGGQLDARLRELVIMRLGWGCGSVYEWTQHWPLALGVGISEETCLAVRDWRGSRLFSELERAVLAATDDTISGTNINDETWAVLRHHLPTAQLVELVVVISHWRLYASLLNTLEIPLEEGVAPWPPDGQGPRQSPRG